MDGSSGRSSEPNRRAGRAVSAFWNHGPLLLVVAAGALVRIGWVVAAHPAPVSDFAWYVSAAQHLAAGQGYSTPDGQATAYWPIGWPLVLAAVFRLGLGLAGGYAIQILAGAITSGLVYVGARRVGASGRGAIAGALMYALLPGQAAAAAILGTEPLFTVLLTAGIVVLLGPPVTGRRSVGSALLIGLATIVRPVTLVWPAVLFVIEILRCVDLRQALVRAALTAFVIAIVVAPLTIRNALEFHALIPVSTNGGINLLQGTQADDTYLPPSGFSSSLSEPDRGAEATRLALQYWAAHPLQMLARAPIKLAGLWRNDEDPFPFLSSGHSMSAFGARVWGAVADISYLAVLGLGVGGALALWRQRRDAFWMLAGFLVYYQALFVVFPGLPRFHFPMIPVVAILAAAGVSGTLSAPMSTSQARAEA